MEYKQRLGPSAEMVMIDRMFIQEEKIALGQDRILAKERPGTSTYTLGKHTLSKLSILEYNAFVLANLASFYSKRNIWGDLNLK